ncbi:PsiF family protein [Dyella acidiphila]|uniref:Phosphate starvation-inducible protein PsiF n=1 Tax=Dyella acidiphila TaxID=2775866 RepID=A0ABR9G9B1_9GAMM|nr:PsiF family protein [Dyella acidiphila]MBE1160624.1 phosphate starvation-inducible protein PsiF [Dyella acidiphila]
MSMRFSLLAASAVLALATTTAFAAPQSSSSTAGHSTKLGQCSHANAGKTGADYKAAVAGCMKGDSTAAPAADAKKTQQQKMADCSHANAGKKGADYKTAMSSCLKSGS